MHVFFTAVEKCSLLFLCTSTAGYCEVLALWPTRICSRRQTWPLQNFQYCRHNLYNKIDILIDGFYEEGCNLMKMITHDKSRHDNCKKKNSTNILHNLQTTKRANCTVGNCRRSDDLIHVKKQRPVEEKIGCTRQSHDFFYLQIITNFEIFKS